MFHAQLAAHGCSGISTQVVAVNGYNLADTATTGTTITYTAFTDNTCSSSSAAFVTVTLSSTAANGASSTATFTTLQATPSLTTPYHLCRADGTRPYARLGKNVTMSVGCLAVGGITTVLLVDGSSGSTCAGLSQTVVLAGTQLASTLAYYVRTDSSCVNAVTTVQFTGTQGTTAPSQASLPMTSTTKLTTGLYLCASDTAVSAVMAWTGLAVRTDGLCIGNFGASPASSTAFTLTPACPTTTTRAVQATAAINVPAVASGATYRVSTDSSCTAARGSLAISPTVATATSLTLQFVNTSTSVSSNNMYLCARLSSAMTWALTNARVTIDGSCVTSSPLIYAGTCNPDSYAVPPRCVADHGCSDILPDRGPLMLTFNDTHSLSCRSESTVLPTTQKLTVAGLNFDTSGFVYGLFNQVVTDGTCSSTAAVGGRQFTSVVVDPYCSNTMAFVPDATGACTVASSSELILQFTVLSQVAPATYILCSLKNGVARPTSATVTVDAPCATDPTTITVTAARAGPAQTVTVHGAYFSTAAGTRKFGVFTAAACTGQNTNVQITASTGTVSGTLVELSFDTSGQSAAVSDLYLCQTDGGATPVWTRIRLVRVNVGESPTCFSLREWTSMSMGWLTVVV